MCLVTRCHSRVWQQLIGTCCRWNSKVMTSANSLEDAAEHLQRNRAVVFEAETVFQHVQLHRFFDQFIRVPACWSRKIAGIS